MMTEILCLLKNSRHPSDIYRPKWRVKVLSKSSLQIPEK